MLTYAGHPENYSMTARTQMIYEKVVKATGQVNIIPPLYIVEKYNGERLRNAYASYDRVIMTIDEMEYDFANGGDDAVALILGHEISHIILGHVYQNREKISPDEFKEKEAQADKYGAFLMMKAGYDICKGRKNWAALERDEGDSIGKYHPPFAYRYAQLNVNCDK